MKVENTKEPTNTEYGYKPLVNVENCYKEYLITEWTSDHAHTSWWTFQEIMNEYGISGGNNDVDEWHCMFHSVRIQAAENILTRSQIAKKFGIEENNMIILD